MNKKYINSINVINSSAETNVVEGTSNLMTLIKEKIKKNHEPYYLLIYKFNEVLLKRILSNVIDETLSSDLNPKYLKEFRLFSKDSELYLWRSPKGFSWRYREDGSGDPVNVYEEQHVIWGTEIVGNRNILKEKFRGMTIVLPFSLREDLPLKYLIRNYFNFDDETGLIKFYDARLVNFIPEEGDIKNG